MIDRRKQYEFSDRLNAARIQAGLTYKDIKRLTGIPIGTIAAYMRGGQTPPPERLLALADAVGVSVDELLQDGKK